MREMCGSVVLRGQGPEEGKEPGALRAGFLEEEEHFRGGDKGTLQWGKGVGAGHGVGSPSEGGGTGVSWLLSPGRCQSPFGPI